MRNKKLVLLVLPGLAVVLGAGEAVQSSPNRPTFSQDVAPIIHKRCLSCHSDSKIAPFSLVGYENVRKRAKTIVAVTESNFMPPWKAKHGYGEFRDIPSLTRGEKEIIAKWASSGAPEGNPALTPPPPTVALGWRLGKPNLLIQPTKATRIPAEGRDFFRDYLIDPNIKEPTWVKAIDFRPLNQGTVHHIIPALISKAEADKLRKIKFDFSDDSYNPGSLDDIKRYNTLGFWSTGAPPFVSPNETAFLIKPGDCIVLNVHYKPKGIPAEEQPQVAMYLQSAAPQDEMSVSVVATGDIYLQPGEENVRVYAIGDKLEHPMTIYAVWPHMHYLGRTFKAWVKFPAGFSKPLIAIDDWDPEWQLLYYLKEPMLLPAGSRIYVTGTYDNSENNPLNPNSPPQVVEGGESSRDEMLFFETFQVVHKPPAKKPDAPKRMP